MTSEPGVVLLDTPIPGLIKMIIALTGKKLSGKSTAAKVLQEALQGETKILSFAYRIKKETEKIFGPYDPHDAEEKKVLRPVYQAVGQAFKERYGETVWVEALAECWAEMQPFYEHLIIDDLRFPYEADWVHSEGGLVWRLTGKFADNDNHISEQMIEKINADRDFTNDGTTNFINQIRIAADEGANRESNATGPRTLGNL